MDGRGEFMGEQVTVSQHSDPSIQGISGKIIDETRKLLQFFPMEKLRWSVSDLVNSCSKMVNLMETKLLTGLRTALRR